MANIHYSRQREMILEILKNRFDHPTADQIYFLLREKLPKVSLGTVYRNLIFLEQEEQVQKIKLDGPDRYDGNVSVHYHFKCTKCQCIIDVPIPVFEKIEDVAIKLTDLNIQGHSIMFYGFCKNCIKY